jgi:hypothetical protein
MAASTSPQSPGFGLGLGGPAKFPQPPEPHFVDSCVCASIRHRRHAGSQIRAKGATTRIEIPYQNILSSPRTFQSCTNAVSPAIPPTEATGRLTTARVPRSV